MKRTAILTPLWLSVLLLCVSPATAQNVAEHEREIPEIRAYRVNPHPPTIDGHLNDPVWHSEHLSIARAFLQREPDDGAPVTESTLVAVAYDEHALYIAFWCYDREPERILKQLVRRDRYSESDMVGIRLDPYHDHQTGNGFEVTAAGVQRDRRYYNDVSSDGSWDAVWESDVQMQPWGWSAEMKIPYHCLRFNNAPEQTWGINLMRYVCRKDESQIWSYTPISTGGFVSNFGHLTGLDGIQPARHLQLLPYVVAGRENEPKSLENPDGKDYLENTGFDLKYGLSSNLILDAAINPDFGQVELDQPVLNLTTFETRFDEKRPFFLEGADLFYTDFSLFYSRRIGHRPGRSASDPEFGYWTDFPDATTILGSAKLTGKLSGGTSIAFLGAVTDEEKADYDALTNWELDTAVVGPDTTIRWVARDTVERNQIVEPRAGYSVLRVTQDVFNNSLIGGTLTMASQDQRYPVVTGGADWFLTTNDGTWIVNGQSVFSRNDPDHTGFGFTGQVLKNAGRHWRGSASVMIKDRHLDLNRLGYLGRNDQRRVTGWVQYRTSDDWWIVRNSWNNFNLFSSWNYDGINIEQGGNWNAQVQFTNQWSLSTYLAWQAEKYSDLETRGNGLWEWPEYPTFYGTMTVQTDPRKNMFYHTQLGLGTDRGGNHWGVLLGSTVRPRSNVQVDLEINYHRYFNSRWWITNVYDAGQGSLRSMFADLDRDEMSLEAGFSVLLNRNLSMQLSAEGLIAALDYWNYRYYEGDDAYSAPVAGINADYNYTALNSTFSCDGNIRPAARSTWCGPARDRRSTRSATR